MDRAATRVLGLGLGAWALRKREDRTANCLSVEYHRRGHPILILLDAGTLPSLSKRPVSRQSRTRRETRRFATEIMTRSARTRARREGGKKLASGAARAVGSGAAASAAQGARIPASDRRPCPHCGEQIKLEANVCRYYCQLRESAPLPPVEKCPTPVGVAPPAQRRPKAVAEQAGSAQSTGAGAARSLSRSR